MIGVLLVVEQTAEVEISVYLPIDCHNQPTFIPCEASAVPASLKTQQLPVILRKSISVNTTWVRLNVTGFVLNTLHISRW